MRRAGPILLALLLLAPMAPAQQVPGPVAPQLPLATLDDRRMFAESAYGRALLARLEAEQTRLAAENREIEAELSRREQDLTERRPGLAPEEFRLLADAFNDEVQQHRAAQQAKERAIYQRHEDERQHWREAANQALAEVMAERGALAIIAEEAIVLGFRELDITDAAIARLDVLVGEGPEPDVDDAPAPQTP